MPNKCGSASGKLRKRPDTPFPKSPTKPRFPGRSKSEEDRFFTNYWRQPKRAIFSFSAKRVILRNTEMCDLAKPLLAFSLKRAYQLWSCSMEIFAGVQL